MDWYSWMLILIVCVSIFSRFFSVWCNGLLYSAKRSFFDSICALQVFNIIIIIITWRTRYWVHHLDIKQREKWRLALGFDYSTIRIRRQFLKHSATLSRGGKQADLLPWDTKRDCISVIKPHYSAFQLTVWHKAWLYFRPLHYSGFQCQWLFLPVVINEFSHWLVCLANGLRIRHLLPDENTGKETL